MNTLPPEVISQIVGYVLAPGEPVLETSNGESFYYVPPPPPRQKSSLTLISRSFQLEVERITFKTYSLRSDQLGEFAHCFRHKHRQKALRELNYTILLPDYTAHSCKLYESKSTKKRNNEVFTTAMVGLLRILNSWEDIDDHAGKLGAGINLNIVDIYSESDRYIKTERLPRRPWGDLRPWRYFHSYLRLVPIGESYLFPAQVNTEEEITNVDEDVLNIDHGQEQINPEEFIKAIPQVSLITEFSLFQRSGRKVDAASFITLVGKMPNVRRFDLQSLKDDEIRFPELRRSMRMDLGKTLLRLCQPSDKHEYFSQLQKIILEIDSPQPDNHSYNISAVHPSHPTTDFLSLGLHALSSIPKLEYFRLGSPVRIMTTCLSPVVFWTEEDEELLITKSTPPKPFWPSLKFFKIGFAAYTPFGKWYIKQGSSPPPIDPSGPDLLNPENEDSMFEQSVTPPPTPLPAPTDSRSSIDSVVIFDGVAMHNQARHNAKLLPINRYRTILDPETFTPLLLSLAKMIKFCRLRRHDYPIASSNEARRSNLAKLAFELDIIDPKSQSDHNFLVNFEPEKAIIPNGVQVLFAAARKKLPNFRSGIHPLSTIDDEDTSDQTSPNPPQLPLYKPGYGQPPSQMGYPWSTSQPGYRWDSFNPNGRNPLNPEIRGDEDKDRLIIRTREEFRWEIIEEMPGVKEALKEAVGKNGVVRVHTVMQEAVTTSDDVETGYYRPYGRQAPTHKVRVDIRYL